MDQARLGAFIAGTRKELGMTQLELAEKLHVTDKAVSKWERGGGYPDVTLLEPLAAALGLGVEELMACRRQAESGEEEPMKTLLTISGESVRREKKRRLYWVTALLLALGAVGAVLAVVYSGRFVAETRRDTVVLKELVGDTAYLYVQEGDHLLRLACGPEVYYAVEAVDHLYQLECKWNKDTYQGTLSRLTPLDAIPLDERDTIGNLVPLDFRWETQDALFGMKEVTAETTDAFTDPYGEKTFYTYSFWQKVEGEDWTAQLLLEVQDCFTYTNADYDQDGVSELIVRTCWPEKPYTVYDMVGDQISETWPDTVDPELEERLLTPWEQQARLQSQA